jgi:hypothetical protein
MVSAYSYTPGQGTLSRRADNSYLPGVSTSRPRPIADTSYLPGVSTSRPGTGGPGFRQDPPSRVGNITAPAAPTVTQASAARGPLNWQDSSYNAQIASIQRALQDFETGAQTRGERYGQDFSTGLSRMGYRPAEGFQAMPNILEMMNQPQAMSAMDGAEGGAPAVSVPRVSGSFDIEGEFDPYSAAARGTRSTRDEFAGRGTLRSSDFAKTFGEFQNRLNQQLEAMETSRGRFGQDLATEVAQQRSATQDRLQAAQRDAMLRAATAAAGGAGF